jgi:hypothetical protein
MVAIFNYGYGMLLTKKQLGDLLTDIERCEQIKDGQYFLPVSCIFLGERMRREQVERELAEIEEFKRRIKQAAAAVDPETAEVTCQYVPVLDPYGIRPDNLEADCIGRTFFARAPGGEWVEFGDLPKAARERLHERIRAGEFTGGDAVFSAT